MDPVSARRLLGLYPGADRAQVEAAFRARVRSAHPDRGGDAERFQSVVEARAVLLGPWGPTQAGVPAEGRARGQVRFVPSSSLFRQVAVLVVRRLIERRRGPRPRRVV